MGTDFDYYFINGTFKGGAVPRLVNDDTVDPSGIAFLSSSCQVGSDYTAHLRIGSPIPATPDLDTDVLPLRGNWRVFSKKVVDAVAPHGFDGLQFVPAVIEGNDVQRYDGFYIANIYRKMESFDSEKTQYDGIDELTGTWDDIEKIVLDRDKLAGIPLKDRLVFVSKEHPGFILYHKTIVDAILSAEPQGISFTLVEEWSDSY